MQKTFLFTIALILVLFSKVILAAPFFVTTNAATGAGSLSQAITDLNTSGATGSAAGNNTITISPGLSTITLSDNLPVIQKGVTITGPAAGQVIDGNSQQFNIFSTYVASLSLSNLTLQNGLAKGGAGAGSPAATGSGGGGGLGAGGGVFVDAGQTLSLNNTTITACKAQGGAGGSGSSVTTTDKGSGGGGGGASWSRISSNVVNADVQKGGGDFFGQPGFPGGAVSSALISAGYGGGAGGLSSNDAGITIGTGGLGGGNGAGLSVSLSANGGNGGYCGGGGGAGPVANNYSGGGGGGGNGGGNPGSFFESVSWGAGGGGGYGSGGGGGYDYEIAVSPGGGGGGFGGGGGGTYVRSSSGIIELYGGPGGGGWGGGGGGGARGPGSTGKGGRFGGNGGGGQQTTQAGGGGGAGVGGGVFVADGSTLAFSDSSGSFPASNISGNSAVGGAAGTVGGIAPVAGSAAGQDVFLFRGASILFNPGRDITAAFAINADPTATGSNKDAGVTVSTTSGAIITISGVNNYQGTTTINSGTLRAGAVNTIPSASAVTLANTAGAIFDLIFTQSIGGLSGGGTAGGNVTLGSASLTVTQNDDATYAGVMSGAGSFTKAGSSNLTLGGANTYTGITTINAGTLSISADNNLGAVPGGVVAAQLTFGGGTLATTSSFTLHANRGITLNAASVIQPASATTLTCNGVIAGANSLTINGAGTLVLGGANTYTGGTNITAGTLRSGGANLPSGRAVTVGASGTFNLTAGTAATLGALTNNGTMTIAANILMPGLILTNNSNMTISGARTLSAATFTSPGTQNYTITDASTYDSFITNSAVNINNGTVIVTSAFTDGTASFDILQGTSLTATNATIYPPATGAFGLWSSRIENNTLKILFDSNQRGFTPDPGVNTEIANVLNAINALTNQNSGQIALISAVNSVTTQQQYNDALTALRPDTSSRSASIAMQNIMLNRIETRLANYDSTSSNLDASNQQVAIYTSGDTASDHAMWFSGFGVVAKQDAHDDFQGYRSNIYGFMLGAETKNEFDTIYGLALGISNADVTATIDTSSATRTQGINLLAYGAAETKTNEFMEWIVGASVNRNNGNRDFSISGTNLNTSAKYTGAVGGAKVNVGKSFTMNDSLFLVPVASLQYMLSHQGEYQEKGSVAALRVNGNNNLNLLTLGAGLRLSKIYDNYLHWLDGSRALSAMLTYDAVSPQQISTASFMVGSGNFSMVNSPVRLALNLGADYSLTVRKNVYLQLSYNLQLRSGYYENFLEAKFRYLL